MRRVPVVLFTVFGALACQDATPFQPESPTVLDLPAQVAAEPATAGPISALIIAVDMLSPGEETSTGVVVHRRDQEILWVVTGDDLNGSFQATGNFLLYDAVGPGHGGFVMDLDYPCLGTFEGNWHGVLDPRFKGTMLGQGTGGCKGKMIRGTFEPLSPTDTYPYGNFVQSFTGTLHDSNF